MSGVSFNNSKNVDEAKSNNFNKDGLKQIKRAVEAEISEKFKNDTSNISKNGNAISKVEISDTSEVEVKTEKAETSKELLKGVEQLLSDPETVIKEIRNSKGEERESHLLNFSEKLDHFEIKELRSLRDYLVLEMASPRNNDDPLLGDLLNKVNKKIDKFSKNKTATSNKKSPLNITQAQKATPQFDPFIIKKNENLFAQKPRMSEDTYTSKLNNRG